MSVTLPREHSKLNESQTFPKDVYSIKFNELLIHMKGCSIQHFYDEEREAMYTYLSYQNKRWCIICKPDTFNVTVLFGKGDEFESADFMSILRKNNVPYSLRSSKSSWF